MHLQTITFHIQWGPDNFQKQFGKPEPNYYPTYTIKTTGGEGEFWAASFQPICPSS